MKLFYSPASPFARKVIMAAHELGLADEMTLEIAAASPVAPNMALVASNPLGKIPTLLLSDGRALYDSGVIVGYLGSLSEKSLTPKDGPARWTVLTEHAAADGLMEAALLARYEMALRPEPLRWDDWTQGQMGKIRRALDMFETAERRAGDDLTLADIGVACGLGYLDFRFPDEDWRASRPRLAAFHGAIATRSSYIASDPNG
jgi:glutathione S-transferase